MQLGNLPASQVFWEWLSLLMTRRGTYSDLVYEALDRPERDIDNQNGHGCDGRHGADWKRTQGNQLR